MSNLRVAEPFITYDYQIENLRKYMYPLRLAFGISLEELGQILGLSRETLTKYEHGRSEIKPCFLLAFRGVLFDMAERLQGEDNYKILWYFFIENIDVHYDAMQDKYGLAFPKDEEIQKIADMILEIKKKHKKYCSMCEIGETIMKTLEQETTLFL